MICDSQNQSGLLAPPVRCDTSQEYRFRNHVFPFDGNGLLRAALPRSCAGKAGRGGPARGVPSQTARVVRVCRIFVLGVEPSSTPLPDRPGPFGCGRWWCECLCTLDCDRSRVPVAIGGEVCACGTGRRDRAPTSRHGTGLLRLFRRRAPFELASVAVQASEVPEMAVWGRSIGVPATGRSAFGSISTGAAPVVRTWQGPCSLLVSPLLQGSLTHDEVPNDERKRGRGCEPPGSG